MTRLIDAWKLCEYANNLKDKCVDANDIMRFPAEDAEQVVLCKNCKHRYLDGMTWNCPFGLSGGEDFFCAYGSRMDERKEE